MNIDSMLKKVDELWMNKNISDEVCADLRAILEAGKEPTPKELKVGGYQKLALRIVESNKRIGELENKAGRNIKQQNLLRRIEALETKEFMCTCPDHKEPHKHNVPPFGMIGHDCKQCRSKPDYCEECQSEISRKLFECKPDAEPMKESANKAECKHVLELRYGGVNVCKHCKKPVTEWQPATPLAEEQTLQDELYDGILEMLGKENISFGEDNPSVCHDIVEEIMSILKNRKQRSNRYLENEQTFKEHIKLLLPLAKGYAHINPHDVNNEIIYDAELFLSSHSSKDKALDGRR